MDREKITVRRCCWMDEHSLLFQMIARMSMAATLALILSQIKLFRRV